MQKYKVHNNVMIVILIMEMDVVQIVEYKLIISVQVNLQYVLFVVMEEYKAYNNVMIIIYMLEMDVTKFV